MRRRRLVLAGFVGLLGACAAAVRTNLLWPTHPWGHPRVLLDVSHHQGDIAWARVHADGAWLKATEGDDWTDPAFEANRAGAEAAGIPWGAYHFYTFCTSPEAQARHFVSVLDGRSGQLPPAIDVERGGNCAATVRPELLSEGVRRFLAVVEPALGRQVLLYVTEDQVDALFGPYGLPERPIWVRDVWHAPRREWTVWQWHARAWVDGVPGWVDLDTFSGDAAAWGRFVQGGG